MWCRRRPAPNCNAYAKRFVRSIKDECLNRVIPIGSATSGGPCTSSSSTTIANAIIRDSGNERINGPPSPRSDGRICRRPRLGGLLNDDCRAARPVCIGSAQFWDITGSEGQRRRRTSLARSVPTVARNINSGHKNGVSSRNRCNSRCSTSPFAASPLHRLATRQPRLTSMVLLTTCARFRSNCTSPDQRCPHAPHTGHSRSFLSVLPPSGVHTCGPPPRSGPRAHARILHGLGGANPVRQLAASLKAIDPPRESVGSCAFVNS